MSKQGALILLLVILFVMAVSVLSGCAGSDQVFIDREVEVKVQVPTPCLNEADVPAPMIYPVDQLTKNDSDGEIVRALLADRAQRITMEKLLRDILVACTNPRIPM